VPPGITLHCNGAKQVTPRQAFGVVGAVVVGIVDTFSDVVDDISAADAIDIDA